MVAVSWSFMVLFLMNNIKFTAYVANLQFFRYFTNYYINFYVEKFSPYLSYFFQNYRIFVG